jgi:L-asparagine transporter-like permease
MWGYPWSTSAGAGLMTAILITTVFTPEFRMTLLSGVPFLVLLSAVFLLRNRRADVDEPVPDINSDEVRL